MKIVLIGKFPPIQGGVSARTYRIAHGLARRGHEVHVVTNAREVEPSYRIQMRDEDWARCDGAYPSGGRVTVHWSEFTAGHKHVPAGPSFVTRLASMAASVAREIGADCIFSFYLEPYGVAGHLASSMTGTPHLVKLAGSDAGHLWQQPDMKPVYDAVLQQASAVFTSGRLSRRLVAAGVAPQRLQTIWPMMVSMEDFTPEGDLFNAPDLPPSPRIGIYGKIHRTKGSMVLLRAIRELLDRGIGIGAMVMSGGDSELSRQFDADVASLGLGDAVRRLPFVAPWRVPGFLRSADIVCSLEQNFHIRAHAPAIFAEAMATGRCLVASTEVALKQPSSERLVHGYNCFLLRDASDPHAVAAALEEALHADREAIGRRARRYAEAAYTSNVLDAVEAGLRRAVEGKGDPPGEHDADYEQRTRGMITRVVRGIVGNGGAAVPAADEPSPNWFSARLHALPASENGATRDALRFGAQLSASLARENRLTVCFRSGKGASDEAGLLGSVPAVCSGVSIEGYGHDFESWLQDGKGGLPAPGECTVAAIPGIPPRLLFVDREQLAVLQSCDGRRTVAEIAQELTRPPVDTAAAVRRLFEDGLLELR